MRSLSDANPRPLIHNHLSPLSYGVTFTSSCPSLPQRHSQRTVLVTLPLTEWQTPSLTHHRRRHHRRLRLRIKTSRLLPRAAWITWSACANASVSRVWRSFCMTGISEKSNGPWQHFWMLPVAITAIASSVSWSRPEMSRPAMVDRHHWGVVISAWQL